jgi:hypothetical protein
MARRAAVALAALAVPGTAAAYEPPPVLYAGPTQGSTAFVGIVKKGERYRAYVSDATAKRATLSVWFRGGLGVDGRLSVASSGLTLDATLTRRSAIGTVGLPDGRVRVHSQERLRRGARRAQLPLRRRPLRRTTVAGTAFDGTLVTGPGIRPNPSCDELRGDYEVLKVQRGRLLRQSGIWELRLNHGRGSGAAYNRLTQAIGALDSAILEVEGYAACDSPSAGSFASAGPLSARNSSSTSLNATGRSAMGM